MRVLFALLSVVALISGPAAAITYTIDLTLNDTVLDADGVPIVDGISGATPDIRLTGTFTTDGTLGALTGANVLDYRLSTTLDGITYLLGRGFNSGQPGFGFSSDLTNVSQINATATELQVVGDFALGAFDQTQLTGNPLDFSSLTQSLSATNGGLVLRFLGVTQFGATVTFDINRSGFSATEALPSPSFVLGTTTMSAVPLPASLWMMLAALGAGGLVARRRARPI